jgi:drug/metabolite transporter (DMT)-like permease
VILKRSPGGSPVAINAVAHFVGAPICLTGSLVLGETWRLPQTNGGWMSLAYLTVVGSVVAFVSFAYLVQRWPVVRISFIAVITPVLATVLGALFAHEQLGGTALAGAVIVVGGVTMGVLADRVASRSA